MLHVAQVNAPVAVLDDPDVHAGPAASDVVVDRAGVVEIVGDQVAARLLDLQAIDHRSLARLGADDETDLRWLGVDQLGEQRLDLAHGFVGVLAAPFAGTVRLGVDVAAHPFGSVRGQRHVGGRVQVDLPGGARELLADGLEVREGGGSRDEGGGGGGRAEELATVHSHGNVSGYHSKTNAR